MQTYQELLNKLRHDISKLNLNRKKLKPEQKAMLDFIEAKQKQAQFQKNGTIVILKREKLKKNEGFEHILKRHYSNECTGKLTPREVLNLGFYLQKEETDYATDYEQNDRANIAYDFYRQELRLRITMYKDGLINRVLGYFSNRKA